MLDRNKSEVDLWSNGSSTYGTLNSSFWKNIERLEQRETVPETASVVYVQINSNVAMRAMRFSLKRNLHAGGHEPVTRASPLGGHDMRLCQAALFPVSFDQLLNKRPASFVEHQRHRSPRP